MKKILSILAILTILSSCKDLLSDVNNKGDLIEVKLSLTGDVTVKEEPLTKAFDSNDLIAIQVYQGNNRYAYGVFDDISNLTIYLHSGNDYSFKAYMVKKKETLIDFQDKAYKPINSNGYYYVDLSGTLKFKNRPSGYAIVYNWNQSVWQSPETVNSFIYSTNIEIRPGKAVFYPESRLTIDSYYGEKSIENINGNNNSVDINLKHIVLGLQCNVTGVSDGTANITIKRGDDIFLQKTDISGEYHSDELLFSCSSLYDAWQYADNYTENVTVSMTWLRGVGVLQDLGSQVVQVKRNSKNVINVSLSTSLSSPEIIINQEE